MANQYEVLGKAPTPEDLKKLSPNEIHLTIKNLNAGYGKMEILHNFDLFPQVTPHFRHHDKSFFKDVSSAAAFLVLCVLL